MELGGSKWSVDRDCDAFDLGALVESKYSPPTCFCLVGLDVSHYLEEIMRSFTLPLIVVCLLTVPWALASEGKPASVPLGSSVQVTLPLGTIQISYIESEEGMVLEAYCRGTTVRARQLYLGDGKIAVKYEASNQGFSTPTGNVNAAMIELKNGSTIKVKRDQVSQWGAKCGEVYLNTESIKFEVP